MCSGGGKGESSVRVDRVYRVRDVEAVRGAHRCRLPKLVQARPIPGNEEQAQHQTDWRRRRRK